MISKEGFSTIFGLAAFAVVMLLLGLFTPGKVAFVLAGISFGLSLWSIYFFRDPLRKAPDDPNVIVSPAEGKVIDIDRVTEGEFIEGPVTRVSIFMSLFNVHVNYVPYSGQVDYVRYHRGKNRPAMTEAASRWNVNWLTGLQTSHGKLAFKQITGFMARRIVNHLRYGDKVQTGQKYGIIKFGSRMEVYLPDWASVTVKKGDQVRAGESVIAVVNEHAS